MTRLPTKTFFLVYQDRVVPYPSDVMTSEDALSFQVQHMQDTLGAVFVVNLLQLNGIQDTIRTLLHCTSSFDLEDVWLGVGGMDQFIQLAGFFDSSEGDAFECALEALQGRGREPFWVFNLDQACKFLLKDPEPAV